MRAIFNLLLSVSFFFVTFAARAQTSVPQVFSPMRVESAANTPKFIGGIFLDFHNANSVIPNAITPVKTGGKISTQPGADNTREDINIQQEEEAAGQKGADLEKDNSSAVTKADTAETGEPVSASRADAPAATQQVPAPSNTAFQPVTEAKVVREDNIDTVISRYAEMIEQDPKKITNYALYRFVDEWYGTDYKWGGSDNDGIDCSALTQKLYNEVFGVDILRTARQQHRQCERIKHASDAEEGDLVFFHIRRFFGVSHVGVYLANGYFVHASSSRGVMISNVHDRYWRRRFASCGRMQKEDNPMTESDNTKW